ncbi:MAG: MFS transporter [Geminicoccaceae bacterium]
MTQALPSLRDGGIRRDRATWYSYLILGFFTYLLNIQGNIIPFLKSELGLGYGAVSLHSSAIAAGMIAVGLLGDQVIRRYGRRRALWLGASGASAGAVLLCLAPAAWASIASCALIGALGALIPSVVPALLAEIHGDRRDVTITEAAAVSYAFAIMAPLMTGLCIALSLGWRNAVLLGAAFGAVIVLWFRDTALADPLGSSPTDRARLPASYWAYWCVLAMAVAIEFCILLWAPEFLGRVVGLPPASAAAGAAAFSFAMLVGRTAGSGLVRFIAAPRLFLVALLTTLMGFLIYWGVGRPWIAIAGLFVLGLGVALLYPLTIGFAIGTAGARGDLASARFMLAIGLAILATPALLGVLADEVGLRAAHLMLPVLLAAALGFFIVAQVLERRAVVPVAG